MHLEKELPTIFRGLRRIVPSIEKDVAKLNDYYSTYKLYTIDPERCTKLEPADDVDDYVVSGVEKGGCRILPQWVQRRSIWEHSMQQEWGPSTFDETSSLWWWQSWRTLAQCREQRRWRLRKSRCRLYVLVICQGIFQPTTQACCMCTRHVWKS